jgi:DNA-binding transcriptional LysR family regulator
MAEFHRRHPQTLLQISYIGSDLVHRMVLDRSAEVMLTLEPAPDEPLRATLSYEPAAEIDYLLVMPRDHPLAKRRSLRLEAVVAHPLVVAEARGYSRHRVQEVLHQYNLSTGMQIAVETSSDEYTLSCVRAGLGVGIVVGKAGSALHHGLAVRPLRRWFGAARVGFLWRRGKIHSAARTGTRRETRGDPEPQIAPAETEGESARSP